MFVFSRLSTLAGNNIGRASFRITRDGEFVTSERVFELFRDVNPVMNRFDLWKVTSAWWFHALILGKRRSGSLVTHVQDVRSGLSGKDTAEQHAAFWKYTIIPALRNFEQIIETQFFGRFGLREQGVFDTSDIPELQESEAERSKRDISEIEAGARGVIDLSYGISDFTNVIRNVKVRRVAPFCCQTV